MIKSEKNRTSATRTPKTGDDDREEVLKKAIQGIEKTFGKGSVMILGDESAVQPVQVISTGIKALDEASHIGGFPRGRMIEIFGLESSGKTSIALSAAKEVQKIGGVVAFVDAEHALDVSWAKKLGVSFGNQFLFSQPSSGEEALSIVSTLVSSSAVDLIIVDSVAALLPQAEIDGEVGQYQLGVQARLMSQAMRKLSGIVSKTNSIVIFINQIRHKIGVFYGPNETTTGGNALKYYASMRLEVKRLTLKTVQRDGKKEVVGALLHAKFVKNKLAPPFGECNIHLDFSHGFISGESELLNRD